MNCTVCPATMSSRAIYRDASGMPRRHKVPSETSNRLNWWFYFYSFSLFDLFYHLMISYIRNMYGGKMRIFNISAVFIYVFMMFGTSVFADMSGGGNGNMRGGGIMPQKNTPEIQAVLDNNANKFNQFTFTDPTNDVSLEYSLFVPENYDASKKYPLLMFIPDATGAGKTAKQIVEQYYGASIWVDAADQAKHPAFILVPAFSGVVVDDNGNVSNQVESAINLISQLRQDYSIDANRIYTTGQSMGCMTSLYMNSKYPDLFAASLFVSGQWDISVLAPLKSKKFFYITAGGDTKASGGQTEVMNMLDNDGIKYTYAQWNAQDDSDTQNASVDKLLDEHANINMVRFETGSVLGDNTGGMEHMASFNYAYKLSRVRDWLFEQTK